MSSPSDAGRADPPREFELKARWRGEPDALRRRLLDGGWRRTFRGQMMDRRLDTSDRRLEARDHVLRLRRYEDEGGRSEAVLGWKGPVGTESGYKVREEWETAVEDAGALTEILGGLGFSSVTDAVDRLVDRFEKHGVTVRIEEYPRMDVLVEIEGAPERVEARLPDLGLPREAWRSWPLPRFVSDYERRTGEAAVLRWPDEGES